MREAELRKLMEAGLAGDTAAHAALLRALVPLLTAFYRRRCSSHASDVDDLMQETLIAVHERRATYDPERPFTGWLYAIARYKLIDHHRRRRETCDIADVEALLVEEGFEDALSARLDVDRLLDALPEKQASAIRATRIDGQAVADHAASSSLSESDVKVSVHRGLKALAARLGVDR